MWESFVEKIHKLSSISVTYWAFKFRYLIEVKCKYLAYLAGAACSIEGALMIGFPKIFEKQLMSNCDNVVSFNLLAASSFDRDFSFFLFLLISSDFLRFFDTSVLPFGVLRVSLAWRGAEWLHGSDFFSSSTFWSASTFMGGMWLKIGASYSLTIPVYRVQECKLSRTRGDSLYLASSEINFTHCRRRINNICVSAHVTVSARTGIK